MWSPGMTAGQPICDDGIIMHMADARGMVPETNAFVKEIWLFNELTKSGATGAPTRGTKEKGDKVVKAVVAFLVDYLGQFEKTGITYVSSYG